MCPARNTNFVSYAFRNTLPGPKEYTGARVGEGAG